METSSDSPFHTPLAAPPEVVEFLRLLGQLISTATVYTFEHKMVQQALDEATAASGPLLAAREKLTLNAMDGALLADGLPVTTRNSLILGLATKLENSRFANLAFFRGAAREDLARLAHVLGMPSAASKPALLGLRNPASLIRVESSSYRRVEDNEVVLKKEDLAAQAATNDSGAPAGKRDGEASHAGSGTPNSPPPPPEPASPETAATQLADVIMPAANAAPAQSAPESAATLLAAILDNLRHKGAELLDGPAVKTRQGRKNLAKLFLFLKAELQERLRVAGLPDTALAAVTETLNALQQDVAVDALAVDYMKKRQAAKAAEGKVVRFLKRTAGHDAAAALQERLREEGLAAETVRELAAGNNAPAATTSDDDGSGAQATVAGTETILMLLARLSRLLEQHSPGVRNAEATQAELKAAAAVTAALDAMMARTSGKLARLTALADELRGGGQTPAPAKRQRAAHHNLFAILAEIIQELLQPLCVTKCAVDLLLGNQLGGSPAKQTDLLWLIADSNTRLQHLAEKLHAICGDPASRPPDPQILDYVYDRTVTKPRQQASGQEAKVNERREPQIDKS
jgi:hypothetical protein